MKNLFIDISYENINIGNDEIDVDIEKIKSTTMLKVRNYNKDAEKDKKVKLFSFKRSFAFVASFILLFCGITAFAVTNQNIRNYFTELFGFNSEDVLNIGQSVESDDYKLTLENMIYDGINCTIIYSVVGTSDYGVQSIADFNSHQDFENSEIKDLISPNLVSYTISTGSYFEESINEKLILSLSFVNPVNEDFHYTTLDNRALMTISGYNTNDPIYSYNIKRVDELLIKFDNTQNDIKIPLSQTINSTQKEISVNTSDKYPVNYTSLIYSSSSFTLIGEIEEINDYYENNKIEIIYPDNTVVLLNSYFSKDSNDHIYKMGDNFNTDSYMQYFDSDKLIVESNFVFNTAVNWRDVEALVINGTRIDLN